MNQSNNIEHTFDNIEELAMKEDIIIEITALLEKVDLPLLVYIKGIVVALVKSSRD